MHLSHGKPHFANSGIASINCVPCSEHAQVFNDQCNRPVYHSNTEAFADLATLVCM